VKAIVQARLDDETQATLERLVRRHGLRPSEIVRKGIRLVAREVGADKPIEIIGLGKYDSGITDLSTNKKHMAGFGGHSRLKGKLAKRAKGR
jgi:antitoxin component of RelBE/YafQ-DinJ toxin-antitoxin module